MKNYPNNSVILSFKDNKNYCIDYYNGEVKPTQWLHDLTDGKAKFQGKDELKRIEISIPLSIFEKIKTNPIFESKCFNLERLQTTSQNVLEYLTSPVNKVDNDLRALKT